MSSKEENICEIVNLGDKGELLESLRSKLSNLTYTLPWYAHWPKRAPSQGCLRRSSNQSQNVRW